MIEKLKCPFCGSELQTDNEIARLIMWRCHTPGCLLNGWHSVEIIQHLIAGKKAQRQLRTAKDRCAKKIKAKEREIANYLNGINVRNKEIETLHKQLDKTQDALKHLSQELCYLCMDEKSTKANLYKQINELLIYSHNAIGEITSITKRENE